MDAMKRITFAVISLSFLYSFIGCEDSAPPQEASGSDTGAESAESHSEETPQWAADENKDESGADSQPVRKTEESRVDVQTLERAEYQMALQKHAGKVLLVDFWATWCVPCRISFPHTVELAKEYSDEGLVVLTVACDDEIAEHQIEEFLMKQNATMLINYRAATGSQDETFEGYEIGETGLPHYKIYDRDGKLIKTFFITENSEGIDPEAVENTVKAALESAQ